MTTWDPDQYARYRGYRDRPALDLLLQVPQDLAPREVWDLGCGSGEHAALLARRYPRATVRGLDASPEMLEAARARGEPVEWVLGDIAAFAPDNQPDLIFTNAALQWLPDHATLFPRLVAMLASGGVFACQMPSGFHEPWHLQLRETAADGPWASKLAGVVGVQPVDPPEAYYDRLSPLAEVDIWATTYVHPLTGVDPVIDWMSGTALRPYLQALTDEAERAAFLDAYRGKTRAAFPRRADGTTLFPFPRLFMVARRR